MKRPWSFFEKFYAAYAVGNLLTVAAHLEWWPADVRKGYVTLIAFLLFEGLLVWRFSRARREAVAEWESR